MPSRTLKLEDLISHYRIIGPIGAGGMGEVYRARDQSLERDVALKILPLELVRSEERVRRFILEAKSASSLNHPHIVTIYEIGQDRVRSGDTPPDPDSSPIHFISMELVTGETLATKIHREKCDLKTLLSYLAQAAEGVAKAHAAGIVHRDLKPGNIMVSKDGYAKVLDFGLAKLTEHQASEPGVTGAPTQDDTREGAVLGTVDYMSPEQVQGKPVDHRSDIFSFGSILYEATTRRRLFAADSAVETMHQILRTDPEPVQALNPQAPAELRRLIRRCLAKNPDQRLDSMKTLALELREIVDEFEALSATPSPGSGVPAIAPASRGRRAPLWIGVAAVVTIGVVTALILFAQAPPRLGSHMTFRTLATPASDMSYPGLSPDGKWVAFGAADERNRWDIYLTNLGGGEIRRVTSDSSLFVRFVDISPDGSRLAYAVQAHSGVDEVRVVSALGGPSATLAVGHSPRWSPDGSKIGYIRVREGARGHRVYEFHTIQPDGSGERRVFADSIPILIGETRTSFSWSPDAKRIAWIRNHPGPYQELAVHDLATGRERQLTHDRATIDEVHWTPQNEIVFSSTRGGNMNLWVIRASGGKPVQLTRGSGPDKGMRVSADGRRMVYIQGQETQTLWISSTRAAHPARVTHDEVRLGNPALSPDGRTIAVPILSEALGDKGQIFLMNRDGTGRRPVTPPGWYAATPRWSPGGRLAFTGRAPDDSPESAFVYVIDPRLPDRPRRLTYGFGANWLDSTTVTFARGRRRWLIPAEGGREEPLGAESTFANPASHRRYAIVFDQRAGREGIWIRVPGIGAESTATYRRFVTDVQNPPVASARGADFFLVFGKRGRVERISLPDLRHTPVSGSFGDLDPNNLLGSLRWDGEECVYALPQVSTKIVLIDHLR
jgi:Tol biopolymer transport system component